MIEMFVAFMQALAVLFLGWGAYLCIFCRDRRTGPRTTEADRRAPLIDLASLSKDRATDFEIGFRRDPRAQQLSA